MEITVNIKMVGFEGGNVKTMSEFLTSIEKFNTKVIMHFDSTSTNIDRLKIKQRMKLIIEQRAKVFKDLNYRVDETEISFGGVCIKLKALGEITEEEFKSAVVYTKEHFKPNDVPKD